MARKKMTRDELNAHAEANSYQRDAHREEDRRRDRSKHAGCLGASNLGKQIAAASNFGY
jgi:hypothetical protein